MDKLKDEFALRVWTPEGEAEEYLSRAKERCIAAPEHQRMSLRVLPETNGDPDGSSPDTRVRPPARHRAGDHRDRGGAAVDDALFRSLMESFPTG